MRAPGIQSDDPPEPFMQRLPIRTLSLLLALLLAVLTGCKPVADAGTAKPAQQGAAQGQTAEDSVSVMIDSVNYMHERGVKYTAYDLSQTPPQAIGGAIVYMLATGGEKGCCLALPKTWRPGIKVRVVWGEADRQQTFPGEYTRDLEIPRYAAPADLYVVFYPEHKVELVVSAAEPGHPNWQGQVNKTPWEQCVETYGRKPCKAALPKQFDVGSSKGYCTYTEKEKSPNGKENCELAMYECMKDYEDEPFCKGILWGEYKK
jgi:hypothetical protein